MTPLQILASELLQHPRLPAVYLDLTWNEGMLRLTLRGSLRRVSVHDLGDGSFTVVYGQEGKDDAFTVADVSAAVGLLMVGDADLRVRDGRISEPLLIASWCDASDSAPPVGVLCVARWSGEEGEDDMIGIARIEESAYPGGLSSWACACDSGWQTLRPPDFWHPLAPFGGEK